DGVRVAESSVGLSAAGDVEVKVSRVEFLDNGIGMELTGEGRTVIEDSVFKDQSNAGIWFVPGTGSAGSTEVANASFEGGRYGLVLGSGRTEVRGSAIRGFGADGILALGGTLDVSGSRIGDGSGTGVHAARVDSVALSDNEIFDIKGMGMLLQAVTAAVVDDNRLYRNGYGIATITSAPAAVKLTNNLLLAQDLDGVVLFGDSPIVTGNRALRNGAAGIRVLNLRAFGTYTRAQPLLADNVLRDNRINEPEFGEYVLETPRGNR
ncbi:MAG TPA: right-handed parallel beta-helix repeat-containing protein, partial [Gammaproteobacteria bacterium]|nr:right-handed parallel beta-helix repeat-containing protein [Gammaproteobacteria bacterium]